MQLFIYRLGTEDRITHGWLPRPPSPHTQQNVTMGDLWADKDNDFGQLKDDLLISGCKRVAEQISGAIRGPAAPPPVASVALGPPLS